MDLETNSVALQSTLDELAHLLINPSRLLVLNNSELGIGGYGEVCLATLDGSSQVAVKQLRIVQAQGTRVRVAVRLARELRIWSRVKHPNVLELLGYYLSENYVCAQLVSPYMAHGNVTEYIKRTQADLGVRLCFVGGVTSGMAYLHSCSPPICHGDLKPANVLVNDEPNAVLCDFGLATFVEGSEAVSGLTTSRSIKGSTRYMGPELFLDMQAKHTLESDVWGWGCTIFEIITDCIPYSTVPSNAHVMLAMVQGQPPGSIESLPKADIPFRPTLDALQDLIPDCWNNDPTKRPPSSHILQQLHPIGHPQEPRDGDGSRTWCYCNRGSYGEMCGCDDDQCQREWFHLGCLGMTAFPKGEWFCDECKARREKEKARKGKEKEKARKEREKARKERKRARSTSFELEEVRPVIPAQPNDFKRAVKRARTSSLLEVVANRSTGTNKYHHDGFASSPAFDDDDYVPMDRHSRKYGDTPNDSSGNVPAGNANTNGNREPGDGDGDRTYCYCDRVSYGEMIGCDDDRCQREWFHFGCLGMTTPPEGEWVCDECKAQREKESAGKKSGRVRCRIF